MAQVPYAGTPTVEPDARAPDDYQHIQVNPDQFGAAIAQGVQKLGAGAHAAGEFFGEVAADNATNQFQKSADKILRGDPNGTQKDAEGNPVLGDDGKPIPDFGYLGLQGRAALDARPKVEAQLDDLLKSTRDGLHNPQQQLRFDEYTRRYRQQYLSGLIGSHAEHQAKAWYAEVDQNNAQTALGHIAANAQDPQEALNGREDLRSAYVKPIQRRQGSPQEVIQAIRRADSDAAVTQINALIPVNPGMARKVFDDNSKIISASPHYDAISSKLTALGQNPAVNGVVDAAFSGQGAKPASSDKIADAIHAQESGGAASAPTSTAGAVGSWQVMPGTFAQYARQGEDINNAADNEAVGRRIVSSLADKYGNDPARIAVGYFSGPGNVSPPGSPTPWINDTRDPNGKSVSSYVTDVTGKLSGSGGGAVPGMPPKSIVYQRILDQTEGNPVQRRQAISQAEERYKAQDAAWSEQSRQIGLESHLASMADRHLHDNQATNFGDFYSRALTGSNAPSDYEIATAAKLQQITPQMGDAIINVRNGRRASTDDINTMLSMAARAQQGGDGDFAGDIANAVNNRQLRAETADAMIKTAAAKSEKQHDQIERASFATLRSYMGFDANMQPMIDFGHESKAAQAGAWVQAQSEWNQRVLVGREDPMDALPDMMAKYSRAAMPRVSLPMPKAGVIATKEDLPVVAHATQQAFEAGQLTQEQYSNQQHLILLHQSKIAEEERVAAELKAAQSAPRKGVQPKNNP